MHDNMWLGTWDTYDSIDTVQQQGLTLTRNIVEYTLNSVLSTPHHITHFLISQNPRERMFVVQISLLIVTFLSLISWIMSLMQCPKEVNPHPRIVPCVNMWSVTFLFLFFFYSCHLLNVGACICHIARDGQVKWTTPTEVRGE